MDLLPQSAGEATAISLKGRPDTRFFGENTGGFTTGNIVHVLSSRFTLLIASLTEADRDGNRYPEVVEPDELIPGGDNFVDLTKDKKVFSALNWLKGK